MLRRRELRYPRNSHHAYSARRCRARVNLGLHGAIPYSVAAQRPLEQTSGKLHFTLARRVDIFIFWLSFLLLACIFFVILLLHQYAAMLSAAWPDPYPEIATRSCARKIGRRFVSERASMLLGFHNFHKPLSVAFHQSTKPAYLVAPKRSSCVQ